MFWTFICTVIPMTLIYVHMKKRKKFDLPPGPRGLPLFGNIYQLLGKNPYQQLSEWAYKYKKIYTIHVGLTPAVVINDPKLIRGILSKSQATGNFHSETLLRVSQGPHGVLNSEGPSWSEQRNFCDQKMKQFGFENKRTETLILAEADTVCEWITKRNEEHPGVVLNLQPIILQSVINTLWTMVTCSRITFGGSEIARLMNTLIDTVQHTVKTGLVYIPWIKYILPSLSGYTAYDKACENAWKCVEKEFNRHKRDFEPGNERDLIDAYIEDAYSTGFDKLKWKNAVASVIELFVCGSEATGSTLLWLLHYLCQNPEIQEKIEEEMSEIIGDTDRLPSIGHKWKMPYTEAVIEETLRMSTFCPIGNVHKLTDDLEIMDYKLPKGMLIISNIYHCHYNKSVWKDPEVFRPERFLEEEGIKLLGHVVPFQLGKRKCLGEHLARNILFIYVTRILEKFQVVPDENEKVEDYSKPDIGYFMFPPDLGLSFKARVKNNDKKSEEE